jgi:4-diphosphocytidyl-2-C-methyl-D-erythritol kinase
VTTRLIAHSFAKVNLALAVLGRRADGYHEIRTVYQAIDLCDRLELRPHRTLQLECKGLDGVPVQDNLVWKAAVALSRQISPGQGAHIYLSKTIPPGSGLGGGSSNAAAALLGLCRLWQIELEPEALLDIAAGLGSDVPFFLFGGTALGVGRGEEIYPLPEISPSNLVIAFPGKRVSTAEAYSSPTLGLTRPGTGHRIQGFCGRLQVSSACMTGVFNDFETSILPAHPEIREAKNFLSTRGATAVLLSGSGSSVFGFFLDEESALAASRDAVPEGWRVFPAKTLSRSDYLKRMFPIPDGG